MENKNEAENITTALCSINKKIGVIGKNRKNEQQGFKFRGIDDVMNELHDLFAEHQVIILPTVVDRTREERTTNKGGVLFYTHLTVSFQFTAVDGSFVVCTAIGEAMDSGDKGTNKAMSIALKYVLLQMFLIPTEEPKDPDAEAHTVTPKQSAKAEPIIKKATITDGAVGKAAVRIKAGELGLIDSVRERYELTPKQVDMLNDAMPKPKTEHSELEFDELLNQEM